MINSLQQLQSQFSSNNCINFQVIRHLGSGKFAEVFLIYDHSKKQLAVKKISLFGLTQFERKIVLNQAKILQFINHPNIIVFDSCYYDHKQENAYILMQYAQNGDLGSLIYKAKQNKKPIKQKLIWQILCDLTQALIYLHEKGIIHRDIKPQNILIQGDIFKIADMNVSKIKQKSMLIQTIVGTPLYASPQIMKNQSYDQKCDIWSLGVVAYQLCCLKNPFQSQNNSNEELSVEQKININEFPLFYSKTLYRCIMRMLQKQPKNRIQLSNIIEICKNQGANLKQFCYFQTQQIKTIIFPNKQINNQNWVQILFEKNNRIQQKLQMSIQLILNQQSILHNDINYQSQLNKNQISIQYNQQLLQQKSNFI